MYLRFDSRTNHGGVELHSASRGIGNAENNVLTHLSRIHFEANAKRLIAKSLSRNRASGSKLRVFTNLDILNQETGGNALRNHNTVRAENHLGACSDINSTTSRNGSSRRKAENQLATLSRGGLPYQCARLGPLLSNSPTKSTATTWPATAKTAYKVAFDAVQIHGGLGYMKESAIEHFFRDAKVLDLFLEPGQIQRDMVADHMLGERRRR